MQLTVCHICVGLRVVTQQCNGCTHTAAHKCLRLVCPPLHVPVPEKGEIFSLAMYPAAQYVGEGVHFVYPNGCSKADVPVPSLVQPYSPARHKGLGLHLLLLSTPCHPA